MFKPTIEIVSKSVGIRIVVVKLVDVRRCTRRPCVGVRTPLVTD